MDANASSQYTVSTWGGDVYSDLVMPSDPNSKVRVKRLSIPMLASSGMLERMDQISPTVEEKIRQPVSGKKPTKKAGKAGGGPSVKQPTDRPGKKLTKAEQAEAAKNEMSGQDLSVMVEMLAVLIPKIIVEPEVLPSMYIDEETDEMVEVKADDRVKGAIYSDTIPINDQMTIFQWAMEGMDMEEVKSFREQQSEDVEPVADDAGVPSETE